MQINFTAVAVFTLSGAVLAQPFLDRIGKYSSKQEAYHVCLDWQYEDNAPEYDIKGNSYKARKCVDDSIDPPNRRRGKANFSGNEDPTLSGNRVYIGYEPYPEEVRKEKNIYSEDCKWEKRCKVVKYFRW